MPSRILRPAYLTLRKRVMTNSKQRKRDFVLVLFTLFTMSIFYFGARMLLVGAEDDAVFAAIFPPRVLQLTFFCFFFLLLLSNTIAAAGNLFYSEGMDIYLRSPLTKFQIYIGKLIQILLETGIMYFIFLFPLLLAFEHVLELPSTFIVLSLLASLPFLIITANLGVIFATIFVRVSSILWRRGNLFVLLALATAVFVVNEFIQLLSHLKFETGNTHAMVQLVGIFRDPNPLWLPSAWLADLITGYVGEPSSSIGLKFLLLNLTAAGCLSAGFLCFDFFLLRVRSSASAWHSTADQKGVQDVVRALLERFIRLMPVNLSTRAFVLKDMSSLLRDRSQAIQLVLFLGIAAFYVTAFKFMGAAIQFGGTATQLWQAFLSSVNILLSGFILIAMMTRVVYPSISLEGRSYWILLVAPIKLEQLIWAKFICWLPLVLSISLTLLLSGVIAADLGPAAIISSILIGTCLSVGCTGIAIGLGAVFANFDWESPSQIVSGFGTLVLLGGCLTLIIVTLVPATCLMVFTNIDVVRQNIGYTASLYISGLCFFAAFFINALAAKIALERGVANLRARKAA